VLSTLVKQGFITQRAGERDHRQRLLGLTEKGVELERLLSENQRARVAKAYRDPALWTKMSILNVANMGKFSTDRTIREYAEEIWGVKSVSAD